MEKCRELGLECTGFQIVWDGDYAGMCYFRNGVLTIEDVDYGDTRDCYETVYASNSICNYIELIEDDLDEGDEDDYADAEDSVAVIEGPTCDKVTLYTECDYLGTAVELEETDNCIDFDPKSVCVPAD